MGIVGTRGLRCHPFPPSGNGNPYILKAVPTVPTVPTVFKVYRGVTTTKVDLTRTATVCVALSRIGAFFGGNIGNSGNATIESITYEGQRWERGGNGVGTPTF